MKISLYLAIADMWFTAVYNTILLINNMIEFDVVKNKSTANASVTYIYEVNKKYKYDFHLINVNNRWVIEEIK